MTRVNQRSGTPATATFINTIRQEQNFDPLQKAAVQPHIGESGFGAHLRALTFNPDQDPAVQRLTEPPKNSNSMTSGPCLKPGDPELAYSASTVR